MKIGHMKTWVSGIALAGFLLAMPATAQTLAALESIHSTARNATTAAEHAAVAKQYRLHSEALDAQAAAHEKNVKDLTRAAGAMMHKWPAMAPAKLQKERTKAVETRRAARESASLAERHARLAVEAQAPPAKSVASN